MLKLAPLKNRPKNPFIIKELARPWPKSLILLPFSFAAGFAGIIVLSFDYLYCLFCRFDLNDLQVSCKGVEFSSSSLDAVSQNRNHQGNLVVLAFVCDVEFAHVHFVCLAFVSCFDVFIVR